MMKEMKNGVYIYDKEMYNFDFYTNLSAVKKLEFVNSVVAVLVDEEHYNSIIRDIIFDFYTIKYFTTIDIEKFEKSQTFLNDVEEFLFLTNIVEIVKANAFPTLFDELNNAVDKSIQYLTGIHPSQIADAISSLISTLEKKINEVDLDSMMGVAQRLANMTDEFTSESVSEQIVKAYMNLNDSKK